MEDGREIFDDEEAEMEYVESNKRNKASKKENKKRLRDVNKPVEGNASIRSMFGNVVAKKETKVKLDEDDILADILGELDPNESNTKASTSSTGETGAKSKTSSTTAGKINEKTEMALVKDYIAKFSKVAPRKQDVKSEAIADDVSGCHLLPIFIVRRVQF